MIKSCPTHHRLQILIVVLLALAPGATFAQPSPGVDQRLTTVRHLDQKYEPGSVPTRATWEARAEQLRQQIQAAAGLLPMPVKGPLNPTIFGRVDRGTYTVEKFYFESLPGFYVTGNLYRPKVTDGKKVPVVLCPHGHWTYGRLENSNLNSTASRAANFAMQGYAALSYDMVGYNDSTAISHRFAPGHRDGPDRESLWSINLLGLQLWNSIRAVDFMLTLPEADPQRISVTGESGGGTQTFLLTAVDPRIQVTGPVNMISYVMQGGSLCENAPNLRIDTENVEIGALAAPRPMIMVSATGDWTRNTWVEEYPAIRAIYRLYNADDRLTTIQINAPHNYNQDSREAVYTWFAKWILGRQEETTLRERGGGVLPANELLVFYGRPRPAGELDEAGLINRLITDHQRQLRETLAAGLATYRATFGPTYRQSLLASYPAADELVEKRLESLPAGFSSQAGQTTGTAVSRRAAGDLVRLYLTTPARSAAGRSVTVIVDPLPAALKLDPETIQLRDNLVRNGQSVVVVKVFPGERVVPAEYKFFTTYNRTDAALRVQDILTALAWTSSRVAAGGKVNLVANGRAGLWALLARGLAPEISRTLIDTAGFRSDRDDDFVTHLPIPGLRRAGDLTTAISLAPTTPLYLHQTGDDFQTAHAQAIYQASGNPAHLMVNKQRLSQAEQLAWLTRN